MKKALFLFWVILMVNCSGEVDLVVKTHFPRNIQISGELARRIKLTTRRLQSHPYDIDFVVQDIARAEGKRRRFEEYEGDISGRTLGAWSYISRLLNQRPEKLDRIAEEILKYQHSGGYFGKDQSNDGFDMWGRQNFGHGRLLVGLVEYYKLTRDERFLKAAKKLGDYFNKTIPEWTTRYEENPWTITGKINWKDRKSNRLHFIKTHQTSVLEGLVMLYEVSHDPKYLETARSIVPLFPEFGQFHSHSYLNTMVGIAKLYLKTGEPGYRQLLEERYWHDIFRYSHRPDGAVCEWFPDDHRTEGCSITDWLRLNLHMWQITHDGVYIDEAERAWYNGLNFHQTANGAFGHAILNPIGYDSDYSEAWWCCLMHGLFAYAEIVQYAVATSQNDVWINFYTPMECQVEIIQGKVQIRMQTTYPGTGTVVLQLNPRQAMEFTIRLHLPKWVENWQTTVNDQPVDGILQRGYLAITRTWKKGDELKLNFPVKLRLEDEYGNSILERRRFDNLPYVAYFFHGPLLLGTDLKWNKAQPGIILFKPEEDYHIEMETTFENSFNFMIPQAHYRIPTKINNQKTNVVFVPICEQTGYAAWTDKLQNFLRNGEKPIQRVPVQIKQKVLIVPGGS